MFNRSQSDGFQWRISGKNNPGVGIRAYLYDMLSSSWSGSRMSGAKFKRFPGGTRWRYRLVKPTAIPTKTTTKMTLKWPLQQPLGRPLGRPLKRPLGRPLKRQLARHTYWYAHNPSHSNAYQEFERPHRTPPERPLSHPCHGIVLLWNAMERVGLKAHEAISYPLRVNAHGNKYGVSHPFLHLRWLILHSTQCRVRFA